jgi:hypothetical protein
MGMLVAVIMDYSLAPLPLGTNWRWMVGLPALFACLQLPIPCLLPESPHWLVSQGKLDEGLRVLKLVYVRGTTRDGPRVVLFGSALSCGLSVVSSFFGRRR